MKNIKSVTENLYELFKLYLADKLTPDHKVYTENRGWVKACKLELTDIILKIE